MSWLSQTERTSGVPPVAESGTAAERADQPGRYLTDGINLYRCLGTIASGPGQLVGLEDCRSLEVVLVPVGDLRARRLRCVVPADGESRAD